MIEIPKFVRVLIVKDQKFLVLKSFFQQQEVWNFPGGKIDPHETPLEAAIREIDEECGITIQNPVLFYKNNFSVVGKLWEGFYFSSESFSGSPFIKEPEKCFDLSFKLPEEIASLPAFTHLFHEPLKRYLCGTF